MADSKIYRRCGCRDEAGKLYPALPAGRPTPEQKGRACPKMGDPKHGSWGYAISKGFDPVSGKRIQPRKMGFHTKDEAAEARDLEMARIRSGRYRGHQDLTVGDYLTSWLEKRVTGGLRPSTAKMYRSYLVNDLVPALGRYRLSELRRADVDKFIQALQTDGRGAVTIHRIHATLSSALSAAETLDLVDYNAASKVALPKVAKTKITIWEPDQAAKFLRTAAQHRLGALFELEVRTGLRRGELCGLRWEDVDLERRELTARVQLTQVAGAVIGGPIKTDAGQDRVVALDDSAVGSLMAWRLHQEIERNEAGAAWAGSTRVFTNEIGKDLRPAYVSRLFDTLVTAAGLPDIRFHDLRHLHASMLISKNVPLAVVSKRLGHSTIAVTADLYGHLMRDANRQAADAVSELLAGADEHTTLTRER